MLNRPFHTTSLSRWTSQRILNRPFHTTPLSRLVSQDTTSPSLNTFWPNPTSNRRDGMFQVTSHEYFKATSKQILKESASPKIDTQESSQQSLLNTEPSHPIQFKADVAGQWQGNPVQDKCMYYLRIPDSQGLTFHQVQVVVLQRLSIVEQYKQAPFHSGLAFVQTPAPERTTIPILIFRCQFWCLVHPIVAYLKTQVFQKPYY